MKKILPLLLCFALSGVVYAGVQNSLGVAKASKLSLTQRQISAINGLTPNTTGELILCIDCIRSAVCVSSGVVVGSWVVLVNTGTFNGSTFSGFAHCQ